MSIEKDAETMREESVEKMGVEVGELYYHSWQYLADINNKWYEYQQLFHTERSRIVLMNETAPAFFILLQRTLWESIVLSITRLTDQVQTGKHENLTVCKFYNLIDDEELKVELGRMVDELGKTRKICENWRNKLFAHLDMSIIVNNRLCVLGTIKKADVDHILGIIALILNSVSKFYLNSTTIFDCRPYSLGNSSSLLYYLQLGLESKAKTYQKRSQL